jgi:hypothetical protein
MIATAAAFAALKLSPWARDPMDLWTLPAVGASSLFAMRDSARRPPQRPAGPPPTQPAARTHGDVAFLDRRWVRTGTVMAAAFASIATMPAMQTRPYPIWRIAGSPTDDLGCASLDARIAKSGKEGAMLAVMATAHRANCPVAIKAARLELGGRAYAPLALPPAFELLPVADAGADPPVLIGERYVSFSFDNEDAWVHGPHDATIVVDIVSGDATSRWPLRLEYVVVRYGHRGMAAESTQAQPGATTAYDAGAAEAGR